MTTHKHLKRLVRERSARTGESYTTARRHVLAQLGRAEAPALPPGLVPGYPTFGTDQHHESTLLARLLRQAGHVAPHTGQPYSEAMACGLGGGIGFMYAVFTYTGLPPIVTIVAQHHPAPWLPTALAHLGVGFQDEHSSNPRTALAALDRELDQGHAVCCVVARNELPWATGTVLPTDPYPVVVAGRSADGYWLDAGAATPRPITRDQFATAWSAHTKGRHHRLVLAGPAEPVDLPAALRSAIGLTADHLTGPVLGHSFDANFGFSGMTRLAEQLRDARTAKGWARRFAAPGALAFGLRRLHDCLELQYTAPGGTRPLYADFLTEAAAVLADPDLPAAADLIRTAGGHWSAVAARAAEVLNGLGPYSELVERRLWLQLRADAESVAQVREISAELDRGAGDDIGDRAALLADLAGLVDEAHDAERTAHGHLTRAR